VPAERIRLDRDHKLAALSYRNASISIWDLDSAEKIGNFEKDGFESVYASPQALDMAFNPIPELELFAIAYKDGDIVTCSPWTLEQTNKYHLQVSLFVMAATSDGRILAGAAEDGGIYLFLFETLQLVYRIDRPDDQIRIHDIAFSADNLRFFDIRGQCCNIWEPFILVPKDGADDSSSEPYNEAITLPDPPVSHAYVFQWGEAITAIEPAGHSDMLLVGRQDGTIDIYEPSTGEIIDKLRLHGPFVEIKHIHWSGEKSYLLSVDNTGRYIVTRLLSIKKGDKSLTSCVLDHRGRGSVSQAMFGPKAESILIHIGSSVKVIALGEDLVSEETSLPESWWMKHPLNAHQLIAIQENNLHIFEFSSLKRISQPNGVSIVAPELFKRGASHPWVGSASSGYLAQGVLRPRAQTRDLIAIEMSGITTETKEVPLQMLNTDSLNVQSILGSLKSSLFFLDANGWVCSISLKNLDKATHYMRHFFIPLTWRTGADTVTKIVSKTAVAFGRGEQLIIFHGFLEFEEKVPL
jgi:WD40 repeat protein